MEEGKGELRRSGSEVRARGTGAVEGRGLALKGFTSLNTMR